MARLRYSGPARIDLLEIVAYTVNAWSERQAGIYLARLDTACRKLAEGRIMGRPCDGLLPGMRRIEQGKHVVFYREDPEGILIVRILHQSMLAERHRMDD